MKASYRALLSCCAAILATGTLWAAAGALIGFAETSADGPASSAAWGLGIALVIGGAILGLAFLGTAIDIVEDDARRKAGKHVRTTGESS